MGDDPAGSAVPVTPGPWMALRDEGEWALSFCERLTPAEMLPQWSAFVAAVRQELGAVCAVPVHRVPVVEQRSIVEHLLAEGAPFPWVVIDPCTQGLGGIDWRLSRVFKWDMENKAPAGFLYSDIPAIEKFGVIDDDIASGSTMREVGRLLGTPERMVSLLAQWSSKKGLDPSRCLDVVDARDFLPGVRGGGLMLELHGDHGRLPYMAPFVNLAQRSIVPPGQVLQVSFALWGHAADFFSALPKALTIADMDPEFVRACLLLGYDPDHSMEKWCRHYQDAR